MTTKVDTDENFPFNIFSFDKSIFFLDMTENCHNCRYWLDVSAHVFPESIPILPKKSKSGMILLGTV